MLPVSRDERGVRDRHDVRWDAMDARLRLTSAVLAYGEIVWVRRPGAGVKFKSGESRARAMVAIKPVTRTKSYKP